MPPPPRRGNTFAPDRQPLDIDRVRALGLQRTLVDHHTRRRLASLADAERRDDNVGDTAILFQRRLVADDRDRS